MVGGGRVPRILSLDIGCKYKRRPRLEQRALGINWRRLGDAKAGLEALEEGKLLPLRESNPDPLFLQPVAYSLLSYPG